MKNKNNEKTVRSRDLKNKIKKSELEGEKYRAEHQGTDMIKPVIDKSHRRSDVKNK